MTKHLRSGELICSELGLTARNLAAACNAEMIIAYSKHTGERMLPAHRCETRFKFAPRPIRFRVVPSYPYITLAIRDTCLKKIDVLIGNTVINSRGKGASEDERRESFDISDFRESVAVLAASRSKLFAKRIRQDVLVHKGKRYVLYLPPKGLMALRYSECEVFPIDKFSFQITDNVYNFEFECLYIMSMRQRSYTLIPWKTSISCKDIQSSTENRKCVDGWDTARVHFDTSFRVCEQCGIEVDYVKLEKCNKYRNKHAVCEILNQQSKLVHFNKDTFKKLKYGADFFEFDYEKFKFHHMLVNEYEAHKIFSAHIFDMLFDKNIVESIPKYDLDAISIRLNPKEFIIDIIEAKLASKTLNEKDADVLNVYAMKSKGKTNVEVYEAFNPNVPQKEIAEFRSFASSRLKKCPDLFERLGIPYVPWKIVSDSSFTEKDIESMIQQVKDFYKIQS